MLPNIIPQLHSQGTITDNTERYPDAQGRPGSKEGSHTLFRRKASHKQRIASPSVTFARIRVDKARLYHQFLPWQAPFDENAAPKLSWSHVKIHHVRPRARQTVRRDHRSDHGRRLFGLTVAAVAHTSPWSMVHALPADLSVAEQKSSRT